MLGTLTALLALAATPASAVPFVHSSVTDVTQCFTCHSTEFGQWKASSPYPTADGLRGHNVTMAQTLTNAGHNTEEALTGECIQCHSPFGAKHIDLTAWTLIGELVKPVDQVGMPTGVWTLKAPYRTAVATSTPVAGFYFPAQHSTDTTHAGWEGISCRVCHDTSTLTTLPNGDQVPTLRFFHGVPPFDAGVTPSYAYEDVASPTALCQDCHQPASDDDRTAPAESVHAGIPCVDCHMKGPDGAISHSLSAGKLGAALATTACNQCHNPAVPAGHPGVTTLDTSFKSAANLVKYGADPSNLVYAAASRRNIHFVTCDSCHKPTASATGLTTFVYDGSPRSVTFNVAAVDPAISGQFAPKGFDDTAHVFAWSKANAAAGSAFTVAPQPIGTTGTFTAAGITQNTNVYFTQATAGGGVFPGVGRGTMITVRIKAKVTLTVSKTKVHPAAFVLISSAVAPAPRPGKLVIQRSRNGSTWTTIATVKNGVGLAWPAPKVKGKYYFRARYSGDKAIAANTSKVKVVTVF